MKSKVAEKVVDKAVEVEKAKLKKKAKKRISWESTGRFLRFCSGRVRCRRLRRDIAINANSGNSTISI